MPQSQTYNFLGTSGFFTNPGFPSDIIFGGQIGMKAFTITMHTDRSVLDTAADGLIMPSKMEGNSGSMNIEMQQTCILHQAFIDSYNALIISDPSNWAQGQITLRNPTLGLQHVLNGVMFLKKPDKPYQAQGSMITWSLLACDVQETTA